MSLRARLRSWRLRGKRKRAARKLEAPLREFVYLDDVSVYSLLASRLGPIATEFSETEAVSLNSEVDASIGGNFGVTKADLRSRVEAGRTQSSQVVRKSIVQTAFKELYELERGSLTLHPVSDDVAPPPVRPSREHLDSADLEPWLIATNHLRRGDLIEAEVELETESIFRVSAVVTTILDIVQENLQLFGAENTSHIAQIRSVGRVLESLLAGLVPIRGRLIDYVSLTVDGREAIVHQALLGDLMEAQESSVRPVFVVGVAERGLFWKDIRRLLFAGAKYRVFCRVSSSELKSEWRPVKLVDVLNEIHPLLGQQVTDIGDIALLAMENAIAGSTERYDAQEDQQRAVLDRYISLLVEHHEGALTPADLRALVDEYVFDRNWLATVDDRRPIFAEVTRRVDDHFTVTTSSEVAAVLRVAALFDVGLGFGGTLVPRQAPGSPKVETRPDERFLDTEIIAIYW